MAEPTDADPEQDQPPAPAPKRIILRGITPQERAFARAYGHPSSATRFQAAESALAAGYAPSTAKDAGWKLLRRPRVQAIVTRLIRAGLPTVERIKHELAEVATAPWRDFVKLVHDPETGAIIDARIDLRDRNKAGEIYLRAEGAFEDPVKRALGAVIMSRLKEMERARRQQKRLPAAPVREPESPILEAEVVEPARVAPKLPRGTIPQQPEAGLRAPNLPRRRG